MNYLLIALSSFAITTCLDSYTQAQGSLPKPVFTSEYTDLSASRKTSGGGLPSDDELDGCYSGYGLFRSASGGGKKVCILMPLMYIRVSMQGIKA